MNCTACKVSMTNFVRLTASKDDLFQWLQIHGVYPKTATCPICKNTCSDGGNEFRCQKVTVKNKRKRARCNFRSSKLKGTFFGNAKLSVPEVCHFVVYWLWLPSPRQALLEEDMGLSPLTVINWSIYCRTVCVLKMSENTEPIGGLGREVDIDVGKIGKHQFDIIGFKEGNSVFSGYDRQSKKVFLVKVETADKDSLLKVINQYILPGTKIYSNCWKMYKCVDDEEYTQLAVNKSISFEDLQGHTRSVEKAWKHVRRGIPRSGPKAPQFIGYLAEYLFKRQYPDLRNRLHHFFEMVGKVYPPIS